MQWARIFSLTSILFFSIQATEQGHPRPGASDEMLQSRAHQLLSLKNEVSEYLAAKDWSDLQAQLDGGAGNKNWETFGTAILGLEAMLNPEGGEALVGPFERSQ